MHGPCRVETNACICLNLSRAISLLTEKHGAPGPGGTGLGYSGYNSSNAEWERGANLKEYYMKKEQQDEEAVGTRYSVSGTFQDFDGGFTAADVIVHCNLLPL